MKTYMLSFRIEMMGNPPWPFIVYDDGRHDEPFNPSTMRAGRVDTNYRAQVLELWDAYSEGNLRIAALEAEVKRLTEELHRKAAAAVPPVTLGDLGVDDILAEMQRAQKTLAGQARRP